MRIFIYITLTLLFAQIQFGFGVSFIGSTPANAQSKEHKMDIKSAPVETVLSTPLPDDKKTFTIIELFTSQICVFCPEADRLFSQLIDRSRIIALSCHVDYFDIEGEALSQPFCTERQAKYVKYLGSGPGYTPQIIINGRKDVIGYKFNAMQRAIIEETDSGPIQMEIKEGNELSKFEVIWPDNLDKERKKDTKLWIGIYDRPHNIKSSKNNNETITYNHVLSKSIDLGIWSKNGFSETAQIEIPIDDKYMGFAVFLQNIEKGEIIGAADYRF